MHEWLIHLTRGAILLIDGMVTVFLVVGTVQVFVNGLRVMLVPSASNHQKRAVWLHFSQWLIAALTIQLAADLLETSIEPSWEDIGKLAAIAGIRTFLDYFLDRDTSELLERDRKANEKLQEARLNE